MNKASLTILVLAMTGCAGVNRHNPQNYAGLTYAELEFTSANGGCRLSGAKIWNGKELANGHFSMSMDKDGMNVVWDVSDSKAIESQGVRAKTEAQIHKQSVEAIEHIIPATVESAVKGAVEAFIPLP